ncbi:hypothetical protein EDB86DRAFT_3080605 [Lactarius hatsudake]|nr:hypothetical protein EDB86DRAFT_3080605 [Lactarius hatsudake]
MASTTTRLDEAQPSVADVQSGAALEKGEVVVEIRSTGICGSDVHFWHAGRIGPMIVEDKHVLGHESAGEVSFLDCFANHPQIDIAAITAANPSSSAPPRPFPGCCAATSPTRRYGLTSSRRSSPSRTARSSSRSQSPSPPFERAGLRLGDAALICGTGPIGLLAPLFTSALVSNPSLQEPYRLRGHVLAFRYWNLRSYLPHVDGCNNGNSDADDEHGAAEPDGLDRGANRRLGACALECDVRLRAAHGLDDPRCRCFGRVVGVRRAARARGPAQATRQTRAGPH